MASKFKTIAPKAYFHSPVFSSMGAYQLRSGPLEVLRKSKRPLVVWSQSDHRGPRQVMCNPQKRDRVVCWKGVTLSSAF